MSSKKDSPLCAYNQRFKTEVQRDAQQAVYDMLREKGASQADIEQYRKTETIRKALDNVHDDARNVKERGSPKKINSAAKSKVAGNMRSQNKAKVTKARADYNKASIDAIVSEAMNGRRTLVPSHSRQNSMLSSSSVTQLYSPSSRGQTMYIQSEMGQALAQKIAEKEQELLQLRQSFSGSDWRGRSATTKVQTADPVFASSPVKTSVQTTSYDVQHQQNRRVTTRTIDSSVVEPVQEDLDEFKVFEEQAAAEAMPRVPQPTSQPAPPSSERTKKYKKAQTTTMAQSQREFERVDLKQQVLSSSVLSKKRTSQVRKQSAKKAEFDRNYIVNRCDLTEIKSLSKPPQLIGDLATIVVEIVNGVDGNGQTLWRDFQHLIANPLEATNTFQEYVVMSQEGKIDQSRLQRGTQFIQSHHIREIRSKAASMGSLYNWLEAVTGAHYERSEGQGSGVEQTRVRGFNAYQHTSSSMRKLKTQTEAPSPVRSKRSSASPKKSGLKGIITEIKAMHNPPVAVIQVMAAVTQIVEAIPEDECTWLQSKVCMNKPSFIAELEDIQENVLNLGAKIADEHLTLTRQFLSQNSIQRVMDSSSATRCMADWLIRVSQFDEQTMPSPDLDEVYVPKKELHYQDVRKSVTKRKKSIAPEQETVKVRDHVVTNNIAGVSAGDICEIKALKAPPQLVKDIVAACCQIITQAPVKDIDWRFCQQCMGNPHGFLQDLSAITGTTVSSKNMTLAAKVLPTTSWGDVKRKSCATASLYTWLADVTGIDVEQVEELVVAEPKMSETKTRKVSKSPAKQTNNILGVSAGDIGEIKGFTSPPLLVKDIIAACCQILTQAPVKEIDWSFCKKCMANPQGFLQDLSAITGTTVSSKNMTLAAKVLPTTSWGDVKRHSCATASLYTWLADVTGIDVERVEEPVAVAEPKMSETKTRKVSKSPAKQTIKKEVVQVQGANSGAMTVSSGDIKELKSLARPPQLVCDVVCAVAQITSKAPAKEIDWRFCQQCMGNPPAFLQEMSAVYGAAIEPKNMTLAAKLLPTTSWGDVRSKSAAASSLYEWLADVTSIDVQRVEEPVVVAEPKMSETKTKKARKSPVKQQTQKEVISVQTPSVQRNLRQSSPSQGRGVKRSDITELKALMNPPKVVIDLMKSALQICRQMPPQEITYIECKKFMSSKDCLHEFAAVTSQVFDQGIPIPDQHMTLAAQFLPTTSIEVCKKNSAAAGSVYGWLEDVTQIDRDCLRTSVITAQSKKISKSPVKQATKKSKKMADSIVPMQRRTNSLSKFDQIPSENRTRMWSLKYSEDVAAPMTIQSQQSNSYYIAPAPMEPTFSSKRPVIDITESNAQYNKTTTTKVTPKTRSKEVTKIEQSLKQHSNPGNKFHNQELESKTQAIQNEFERLRNSHSGLIARTSTTTGTNVAGTHSQDNFYTIMDDFYHGEDCSRHDSPTKRLIAQKNSAWKGKEKIQHDVRRKSEYALHYTTEPGKSYVIEPKEGEINYDLAYKNPRAFYNEVMTQEVTEHKVYSPKKGGPLTLQSTIMKRQIGEVLFTVMLKMHDLLKQGGLQEGLVETAMQDEGVKKVIYNYMKQDSIKLVDHQGKGIFRKQTRLIGEKGDRAMTESPTEHVEGDPADLDRAKLVVEEQAFNEVQKSVNDYIRKQSKKK